MSAVDDIAAYLAYLKTSGNRIDQIIFDELPNGGRMTATDELRRLLDERGVEWTEPNNEARSHTTYWTAGALRCMAVEFTDGVVSIASSSHDLTPAQAVEATLGSYLEAENEELRELVRDMWNWLAPTAVGGGAPLKGLHNRMRELGVDV